jgi:hypothetical protein
MNPHEPREIPESLSALPSWKHVSVATRRDQIKVHDIVKAQCVA